MSGVLSWLHSVQTKIRLYRLAVRTAPSHGANSGSSPDKVTTNATLGGGFFRGDLIGKDEENDFRVRKNTALCQMLGWGKKKKVK